MKRPKERGKEDYGHNIICFQKGREERKRGTKKNGERMTLPSYDGEKAVEEIPSLSSLFLSFFVRLSLCGFLASPYPSSLSFSLG